MGTESSHCGHDDQAGREVTGKSSQPFFGLMLSTAFTHFKCLFFSFLINLKIKSLVNKIKYKKLKAQLYSYSSDAHLSFIGR